MKTKRQTVAQRQYAELLLSKAIAQARAKVVEAAMALYALPDGHNTAEAGKCPRCAGQVALAHVCAALAKLESGR